MVSNVHFSSETSEWATPQEFFDRYNAVYKFNTDVCADHQNAKCFHYYTEADSCLDRDWSGVCWMNPPYGDPEHPCKKNAAGEYTCKKKECQPVTAQEYLNAVERGEKPPVRRGHHIDVYIPGIIDFMRKAYEQSQAGVTVVCLVPARTCTEWWHEYAMKGEVEFIRGRLKFGGAKNSAPFPSAVVVFKPKE